MHFSLNYIKIKVDVNRAIVNRAGCVVSLVTQQIRLTKGQYVYNNNQQPGPIGMFTCPRWLYISPERQRVGYIASVGQYPTIGPVCEVVIVWDLTATSRKCNFVRIL